MYLFQKKGITWLKQNLGFEVVSTLSTLPDSPEDVICDNCGWAADTVMGWVKTVAENEAKRKALPPSGLSCVGKQNIHIFCK